ncbi:iron-containing redox enzyme family protein [Nitrospina gracilis]|nr:iron-containing redox enzyme family protein [Nitrospina gracilis]
MSLEYKKAESEFIALINCDDLDGKILAEPHVVENFNEKIHSALKKSLNDDDESAHLFVQRCLYKINRLKLFWDDDLRNYSNENSRFLFNLRSDIENQWSVWEEKQFVIDRPADVAQALCARGKEELNPELSEDGRYIRDHISEAGYRRLLAIASLDGLVEASQLSRVLGGASSEVQLMLTRILWEEYGSGKLERKHSTFFAAMLDGMGLDSRPEAYFDLVPWEVLANINHSFMVSEQKRKYLRYVGGLLFIEVSVPASFTNNKLAGERLGLSPEAISYWDIHIKEDIRHGQWMLDDVALPLVEKYEKDAWEIVLGYDQQKYLSARAFNSVVDSIQSCENAVMQE